jgi:hypothetical protein
VRELSIRTRDLSLPLDLCFVDDIDWALRLKMEPLPQPVVVHADDVISDKPWSLKAENMKAINAQ